MTLTDPPTTPPTQTLHPWRATLRTGVAATLGLLPLVPTIVNTAGLATVPWLAGIVGVAAGVTRVLAVPAVNTWLTNFLPFLAAKPREY